MIVMRTAINARSMSLDKSIKMASNEPAESKIKSTATDDFTKRPICDSKTNTRPAINMIIVAPNKRKNIEIPFSNSAAICEQSFMKYYWT